MKRIVIGLVSVAAFAFCGMFASSAQADHGHRPHHHGHRHHHYCRPPVVHQCYPSYGGYGGYGVYRPAVVPYGAGYNGGYQPYSGGFYVQQPRFGLSIGF